ADGRLSFRGQPSETAAAYAQLQAEGLAEPARILPDRDAPAQGLLKLAQELRGLGAERIVILTKQALS
ncbi:MAG: biopolymer transporter ExbD, partial [Mangrovicoccus sp.]